MYYATTCCVTVARELLAAGRVQFKNCVLGVSDPCHQTQTDVSDARRDIEQESDDISDTIQVSDGNSSRAGVRRVRGVRPLTLGGRHFLLVKTYTYKYVMEAFF